MGVSRSAFWESPLLQLRGGAFHMRELLDRYNNNIINALVGYNAGTKNADYLVPHPGREIWELENTWRDKQPRNYIKAILGMADGGIVTARSGGILANIGEGRYDEAVIPLPDNWRQAAGGFGGGQVVNNVTVVIQGNALASKEEIATAVVIGLQHAQRTGRTKVAVI
jgi:hypothetical protein